jgi:hypothetical protein
MAPKKELGKAKEKVVADKASQLFSERSLKLLTINRPLA